MAAASVWDAQGGGGVRPQTALIAVAWERQGRAHRGVPFDQDVVAASPFKGDAIRPAGPRAREEGLRVAGRYLEHYNGDWLYSAIRYVTPNDVLVGRQGE